jgi:hypothetical protein
MAAAAKASDGKNTADATVILPQWSIWQEHTTLVVGPPRCGKTRAVKAWIAEDEKGPAAYSRVTTTYSSELGTRTTMVRSLIGSTKLEQKRVYVETSLSIDDIPLKEYDEVWVANDKRQWMRLKSRCDGLYLNYVCPSCLSVAGLHGLKSELSCACSIVYV